MSSTNNLAKRKLSTTPMSRKKTKLNHYQLIVDRLPVDYIKTLLSQHLMNSTIQYQLDQLKNQLWVIESWQSNRWIKALMISVLQYLELNEIVKSLRSCHLWQSMAELDPITYQRLWVDCIDMYFVKENWFVSRLSRFKCITYLSCKGKWLSSNETKWSELTKLTYLKIDLDLCYSNESSRCPKIILNGLNRLAPQLKTLYLSNFKNFNTKQTIQYILPIFTQLTTLILNMRCIPFIHRWNDINNNNYSSKNGKILPYFPIVQNLLLIITDSKSIKYESQHIKWITLQMHTPQITHLSIEKTENNHNYRLPLQFNEIRWPNLISLALYGKFIRIINSIPSSIKIFSYVVNQLSIPNYNFLNHVSTFYWFVNDLELNGNSPSFPINVTTLIIGKNQQWINWEHISSVKILYLDDVQSILSLDNLIYNQLSSITINVSAMEYSDRFLTSEEIIEYHEKLDDKCKLVRIPFLISIIQCTQSQANCINWIKLLISYFTWNRMEVVRGINLHCPDYQLLGRNTII